MTPLRFAITSPPSGCEGDLHPQAVNHARRTQQKRRSRSQQNPQQSKRPKPRNAQLPSISNGVCRRRPRSFSPVFPPIDVPPLRARLGLAHTTGLNALYSVSPSPVITGACERHSGWRSANFCSGRSCGWRSFRRGSCHRETLCGARRHRADGWQTMSVPCRDVSCRTEECAFRVWLRKRQARTAGSRTMRLLKYLFS